MANTTIAPPRLEKIEYEKWRKEMTLWQMATNVVAKKQAPTVFLSLTGKAREAVLEMNIELLNQDDGMTKLYEKLDSLFATDKDQAALHTYEKFEKFTRPSDMNMSDFRIEFDRLVQQLKGYAIELPEPVLAYRALKSANLSPENEKLVRATVPAVKLESMMLQLKKVAGLETQNQICEAVAAVKIKQEPNVNFNELSDDMNSVNGDLDDVYYASRGFGGRYRGVYGERRGSRYQRGGGRSRYRGRGRGASSKKTNPIGPDGGPSTCHMCGSFMHWARDCPHKESEGSYSKEGNKESVYEANIVLLNLEDTKEKDSTLLGQTIGSAILDSGCARSVCGKEWYDCFLDTLPESTKKKIKTRPSNSTFRFGNGEELKSKFNVNIPCNLVGKNVEINTDVIDSPVPLLLSKKSMKKANCLLDFSKDTMSFLGKEVKLQCTDSGHYFISLTKSSMSQGPSDVVFLRSLQLKSQADQKKIAVKLHKQFSHPSSEKLITLVKNSGVNDSEFISLLKEVSSNCDICIRHKRVEPKPIVSISMATQFNDVVAMDIKEIHGKKVLHMIDHATRYSVAAVLKNKESCEIVSHVFKYWVSYFGAPRSFLTDNGREFDNMEFREMAQNLNSIVRTTAAFSPWSNGLNERHNGILGEMVKKTLEDVHCSMDIALGWSVSAKNSLANVNGFSANQLVFGYNPNMPSVLVNRPPALEGQSTSEVVARNLNAMHAARQAFIKSESSEKLQRALRHQTRHSEGGYLYVPGDMVYFKRPGFDRWMGPGTVIGSENKQVIVKHGGSHVRVHPCRLQRYCSENIVSSVSTKDNDCDDPATGSNQISQSSKTSIGENTLEIFEDNWEDPCDAAAEELVEVPKIPPPASSTSSPRANESEGSSSVAESSQLRASSQRNKIDPKWCLPQPGDQIKCKLSGSDNSDTWTNMKVISRGGKASGPNRHVMNISIEGKDPTWLDFKKSVVEWKLDDRYNDDDELQDTNEVLVASAVDSLEWNRAKASELNSWADNRVFTKVTDCGQDRIQTRWVCTYKDLNGGKVAKARLVAKGFQDPDAASTRSDSPTCAKESLRLVLMLIASNKWTLNSMDIKTAFLQGMKFDRDVYLLPPPEAKVEKGYIWKLNKCVYGLTDASRVWYLTVRDQLLKFGMKVSAHDEAVFVYHHSGHMQGIVSAHVDDFCWAGTNLFEKCVISNIRQVFKVKSEEKNSFRYLGLDLFQENGRIMMKQDKYVQTIELIKLGKKYTDDDELTEDEMKQCRSVLGKLNWLAMQTRPDLCFDVSELTSSLRLKKVSVVQQINKSIRKAKRESSQLEIPHMPDMKKWKFDAYSDASFANVDGTKSQGGYIIYMSDNTSKFPLAWQSQKVKRVVKSTHAAETLALVDAAEASMFYKSFLLELTGEVDDKMFPISCHTDSAALHGSVHSNTQILDKRLRIETAILREMLSKKEIATIHWVPTDSQLADALTKSGVPSSKILCT